MSRTNAKVAPLIARRQGGINNDSPTEALKRISPDPRIHGGTDAPAGLTAALRGCWAAFQKSNLATTANSLRIARENVKAAKNAVRDADFAVETLNLTRAQILIDKVSRPRAGDQRGGLPNTEFADGQSVGFAVLHHTE